VSDLSDYKRVVSDPYEERLRGMLGESNKKLAAAQLEVERLREAVERAATRQAIAADFGASEWRAFVPTEVLQVLESATPQPQSSQEEGPE
jgi:hypothetical protein